MKKCIKPPENRLIHTSYNEGNFALDKKVFVFYIVQNQIDALDIFLSVFNTQNNKSVEQASWFHSGKILYLYYKMLQDVYALKNGYQRKAVVGDLAERGYFIFLFEAWRLHALKRKLNPNFFIFWGQLVPVVPLSCLGLSCLRSYRQLSCGQKVKLSLWYNMQPYERHSENAQYQIFRGV